MSDKQKGTGTRLVQAGRPAEWLHGMVNVPVNRTSTVLFDSVADLQAATPGDHRRLRYGLQGTATHWGLADALTELEPGAAGTALVPSGLAAITAPLTAVLSAGQELLMVDSCYGPTRRFCDEILARYGVITRYYDPLITPAGLDELIGPSTRALFLESPGSQTFEVQDVPGLCAAAKARGLVTLLDNTWATPLLFPALANGVDISTMALTKYVAGHSDVLLGSVTANAEWYDKVQGTVFDLGHSVSADDAYLCARGLRTMHVRLARHGESALAVARWLVDQPQVATVLHPALPSCPGHEHWRRDFRGASSLFAFVLKDGGFRAAAAIVDRLQHFGIGYSFGGYESLALPVQPKRTASARPPAGIVRLHIGLEDVRDLIADLEQALAAA